MSLRTSVNNLHNSGLECANGNFAASWDGCLDQGSVRIRCPRDYFPCNDLSGNRIEFGCWENCTGHGGVKDCITEGIFNHSAELVTCLAIITFKTFLD